MTGADVDWDQVLHLLACRSGQRCEICGRPLTRDEATIHHRLPRGMGGTSDPGVHDLARLMLLCGGRLGGVRGCHGITERHRTWAYRNGYLIHRAPGTAAPDPATVPVVLRSGRRVLLTPYAYVQAPGPAYAAELPSVEMLAALRYGRGPALGLHCGGTAVSAGRRNCDPQATPAATLLAVSPARGLTLAWPTPSPPRHP